MLRGTFEGKDTIVVTGVLENEDGDKVALKDLQVAEDGKMSDADGKKVKITRLDFQGEVRGLPEAAEPVSAGVGEDNGGSNSDKS